MASIISGLWGASKYLPANMAMGLLKKSFPKLNGFFSKSLANGLTAHQILEFMNSKISDKTFQEQLDNLHSKNMLTSEEKIVRRKEHSKQLPGKLLRAGAAYGLGGLLGGGEESQEMPQEAQSEMQPEQEQTRQYDPLAGLSKFPELMQFIQREVQKGKDPTSVAQTAKKSPKLSPMVQMIEREIEEPFEDLLERLFTTFKGFQQAQRQPTSSATEEKKRIALEMARKLKGVR